MAVTRTLRWCPRLELEVYEWLHFGRDELVDDEDSQSADHYHDWQGKFGKRVTIAALKVLGEPVYCHANAKEQEYLPIGGNHFERVDGPFGSDACHHRSGDVPGGLVGNGRIKIRTGSEEQAGEGDESEGDEHRPSNVGRLGDTRPADIVALRIVVLPDAFDNHAAENEDTEAEQYIPKRQCGSGPQSQQEEDADNIRRYDDTLDGMPIAPELEDDHANTVQTTPDHKVARSSMPKASEQHGDHGVHVGVDVATFLRRA